MRLILGPMEGVLDHLMRDLLTKINDYDLCVTEFVRVVDRLLPVHVFTRLCPELAYGAKTPSGTPVRLQLLGQDPNWMAENARRAIELGSQGIDLNFGCPAKLVNKSRAGAILLQNPEQIYQIVKACREALPKQIPLSAKIRLGWDSPEHCLEISDAITQAGANELTVHGRTKSDGYKADKIKWDYIYKIKKHATIPVIANGEIWNYQDGQNCLDVTKADGLMICRGALNTPNLGNIVKYNQSVIPWSAVITLLLEYSTFEIKGDKGLYYPNRIKQWLAYLRKQYPQADDLFRNIRKFNQTNLIVAYLHEYAAKLTD